MPVDPVRLWSRDMWCADTSTYLTCAELSGMESAEGSINLLPPSTSHPILNKTIFTDEETINIEYKSMYIELIFMVSLINNLKGKWQHKTAP